MPSGPTADLDVTSNKVFVPWREFQIAPTHVIIVTACVVTLISLSWAIDSGELQKLLIAIFAAAILTPLALVYTRRWFWGGPATPLAFDEDRILGESPLWGATYVTWSSIYLVALVHSPVGSKFEPIGRNLLIYRKKERPLRLGVPKLSYEEEDRLALILGNIAKLHYIEFIHDTTDQTNRRIRNLDLPI